MVEVLHAYINASVIDYFLIDCIDGLQPINFMPVLLPSGARVRIA